MRIPEIRRSVGHDALQLNASSPANLDDPGTRSARSFRSAGTKRPQHGDCRGRHSVSAGGAGASEQAASLRQNAGTSRRPELYSTSQRSCRGLTGYPAGHMRPAAIHRGLCPKSRPPPPRSRHCLLATCTGEFELGCGGPMVAQTATAIADAANTAFVAIFSLLMPGSLRPLHCASLGACQRMLITRLGECRQTTDGVHSSSSGRESAEGDFCSQPVRPLSGNVTAAASVVLPMNWSRLASDDHST